MCTEIKAVDPEQRDSLVSDINAQGKRADSRYDGENHCWWVWEVPEKVVTNNE